MIPPNLGDLSAAARVLMCVAPAQRRDLMSKLLIKAQGHERPTTLMAVALRHPAAPEPSLEDLRFLSCLQIGIEAMIKHYRNPPLVVRSPDASTTEAPKHARCQTRNKRVPDGRSAEG